MNRLDFIEETATNWYSSDVPEADILTLVAVARAAEKYVSSGDDLSFAYMDAAVAEGRQKLPLAQYAHVRARADLDAALAPLLASKEG
jgi:hypothetical protein